MDDIRVANASSFDTDDTGILVTCLASSFPSWKPTPQTGRIQESKVNLGHITPGRLET